MARRAPKQLGAMRPGVDPGRRIGGFPPLRGFAPKPPMAAALALVLAAAAGCALGPNYKRPDIVSPPHWRDMPAAEAESLANTPWWQLFDDPQLQALIRIALAENKDLKIAVERIEEARARYGFTRADLFPKVDASGTAGRLRFNDGSLVHTPEGDQVPANQGTETPIYAVSADVSWELDFFGRIRRATEAQRALLLGTEEARRSTVLTLVADVAIAYLELRDFDRRLEIARRTIGSRRESLQLASDRFEGGLTPELDKLQAEAELHRTEAIIFDLERLIAFKENELSVLLGRNPGPILRGRTVEEQKLPGAVPAGLPSALLDRRPDVREAEQVLAAATANIGEAKALLFPRISLTGSYGFASTEFDTLFEGPSKSWNLIGNLLQPIFNAGKNKRRVQITESRQRQTLYFYERTVIQAFRETEDALVSYRKTGEQSAAQGARVGAERRALELAEMRYRGGVSAYLEVLDAQRSLFGAELDEAETVGNHLTSLVRLYKALGGGWPAEPQTPAATATP
jgi:outer membrane protein, multidrug efflux system